MNPIKISTPETQREYGLKHGAEEFPLMIILSIVYPCNLGCPNCPYTDGNSEIRRFYREHDGDLIPVKLWRKSLMRLARMVRGCVAQEVENPCSILKW